MKRNKVNSSHDSDKTPLQQSRELVEIHPITHKNSSLASSYNYDPISHTLRSDALILTLVGKKPNQDPNQDPIQKTIVDAAVKFISSDEGQKLVGDLNQAIQESIT